MTLIAILEYTRPKPQNNYVEILLQTTGGSVIRYL